LRACHQKHPRSKNREDGELLLEFPRASVRETRVRLVAAWPRGTV
jgi:hypothetical protein